MSDPFEILGIPKGSTEDEIKKAYRKLAMKHHPDKGGDPEMFKKISQAYDDALKPPQQPNFFDMMFPQQKETHIVEIEQRAAYFGTNINLNISFVTPCKQCLCPLCSHRGVLQLGPFQHPCPQANIHKKCSNCKDNNEVHDVHIPPRTPNDTVMNISNTRNICIKLKPDPILELVGNDFIYKVNISFKESLVGTTITIPHYDGPLRYVTNFTKPTKKYIVKGKGFSNGNLIIQFNIQYPDAFTEEQIDMFKKCL